MYKIQNTKKRFFYNIPNLYAYKQSISNKHLN
jgi:hypothetical protein